MRKRTWVLYVGIALFTLLAGLQVLSSWLAAREVQAAVAEVRLGTDAALGDAKTAEEVIAARILRRKQGLFWHQLNTSLGPLVSILGALLGGLVAWRSYLDTRNKEQEERVEAARKERADRGATEMKEVLELLVSSEVRKQVVGAVGLQHFLTRDRPEDHRRALVALAAAARFKDPDPEVVRGLRLAAEVAFREVPAAVLAEVSWQGAVLTDLHVPARPLPGLDFTDAKLERAELTACDLSGSAFRNALAKGARFDGAKLDGADFTYADLAGADFRRASLAGAKLDHARIADLDLAEADLRSARFDPDELPFDRTRHWRQAHFAPEVLRHLEEKYGALPVGPRVLMLLWEFPPYVAGGTWTAAYHLVRVLRRAGANLAVVVPWAAASRVTGAFGTDVEVLNLGLTPPESTVSPYGSGPYGLGPYSFSRGPYGRAYDVYGSFQGPYARSGGGSYTRSDGGAEGSAAMRLREEFRRLLLADPRVRDAEVIHAHDWITFDAAEALASRLGVPWLAHFHSLESDRRAGDQPDPVLAAIEGRAALTASALVVPSRFTAARLAAEYGAPPERIHILPNPLSPEPPVAPDESGRFETRRVVFTGRLTAQKGPDRFREIGDTLAKDPARPPQMAVYGEGESADLFAYRYRFELAGPLAWDERGKAFAGASAVIVPSRAEPFGMVVLEALRHRVPVFFPAEAGVAEVIPAGIPIDPASSERVAAEVRALLDDWQAWERVVAAQSEAYDRYVEASGPEVFALWSALCRSVIVTA
jgi:glycosyltransferase involved in cell wall biosynthesis